MDLGWDAGLDERGGPPLAPAALLSGLFRGGRAGFKQVQRVPRGDTPAEKHQVFVGIKNAGFSGATETSAVRQNIDIPHRGSHAGNFLGIGVVFGGGSNAVFVDELGVGGFGLGDCRLAHLLVRRALATCRRRENQGDDDCGRAKAGGYSWRLRSHPRGQMALGERVRLVKAAAGRAGGAS